MPIVPECVAEDGHKRRARLIVGVAYGPAEVHPGADHREVPAAGQQSTGQHGGFVPNRHRDVTQEVEAGHGHSCRGPPVAHRARRR